MTSGSNLSFGDFQFLSNKEASFKENMTGEGLDSEVSVNQNHLETCLNNSDAWLRHMDSDLMSLKGGPGICIFNKPSR